MNKKELSKALRPIIKECVNEVILEDGTLSKIISEVVLGFTASRELMETPTPELTTRDNGLPNREATKLKETKRRMLDAIGSDAYSGVDLFEGTTPLSSAGSPNTGPSPQSPLSGVDPRDKGVDIARLFPELESVWKKLI